jgi:hypothetical protein
MDVPLRVALAVLLVFQAETILTPGANRSRQLPKLENVARASLASVAPTVTAAATRAGEKLHAFELELPAATTNAMPASMALFTA